MRATITVPDELFAAADNMAESLGISRSKLYQVALERHLRALRDAALTEQVNACVDADGQGPDLDFAAHVAKMWAEDMGDDEW